MNELTLHSEAFPALDGRVKSDLPAEASPMTSTGNSNLVLEQPWEAFQTVPQQKSLEISQGSELLPQNIGRRAGASRALSIYQSKRGGA